MTTDLTAEHLAIVCDSIRFRIADAETTNQIRPDHPWRRTLTAFEAARDAAELVEMPSDELQVKLADADRLVVSRARDFVRMESTLPFERLAEAVMLLDRLDAEHKRRSAKTTTRLWEDISDHVISSAVSSGPPGVDFNQDKFRATLKDGVFTIVHEYGEPES